MPRAVNEGMPRGVNEDMPPGVSEGRDAVAATHAWFDRNSGWAEPTRDTLEEWLADGVCQCPDECWVRPDAACVHGLASWYTVLAAMGELDDLAMPVGHFANAPNFRDVGGIVAADGRRVRPGLVFRSGVMDQLDDDEVAAFAALGIRTVIDLRGADEIADRPNRVPEGVEQIWLQVLDVSAHPNTIMERLRRGDTEGLGAGSLVKGNELFAARHAGAFGEVVRLVADAGRLPVVIHCTAGKDRTGFAIACVLWALGVDHEAVVADYVQSNVRLADRHEHVIERAAQQGIDDPTPLLEMLDCRREYLDAGRDAAVATYGSIDNFVRDGLGLDAATVAALRAALLS